MDKQSDGSRAVTLDEQLRKLLAEGVDGALERERTAFDQLTANLGGALVLFGAGNLGRRTLKGLRSIGIEPLAFIDNNSNLWGKSVDGMLVLSPEAGADRYRSLAAFVITIWRGEGTDRLQDHERQLKDLGCEAVVSFGPLYWKHADVFLPHYAADLAHKVHLQAQAVCRAYELWADDASRREYIAQISWRLSFDFDGLPDPVNETIYFPGHPCGPGTDEVYVDCGAFDGDTLRSFLHQTGSQFRRIFVFEPDPVNLCKLREAISHLPEAQRNLISVHNAAVGDRRGKVAFSSTGNESASVGIGNLQIDCVTLDEVLNEVVPTYLKMDIEGYEIEALKGARHAISSHTPVLAVCCYHRQDHLWQIPLLIHSINPDYQFFLRPHLLEVWDSVCYAVPPGRVAPPTATRAQVC